MSLSIPTVGGSVLAVAALVVCSSGNARAWEGEIWIHSQAEKLPSDQLGPFVRLSDGSVMGVHDGKAVISTDDGETWESRPIIQDPERFDSGVMGVLFRTRDGVIVRAFMNSKERVLAWDYADGSKVGPLPECQLPVYITRSLDEGQTWEVPEKLQSG